MIDEDRIMEFMEVAPQEVLQLVSDWMLTHKKRVGEAMDLTWCDSCEDWREITYHMTHRQTLETPEEGVFCCSDCGRCVE
jgi:uncharacterized heparinase superfamily protein